MFVRENLLISDLHSSAETPIKKQKSFLIIREKQCVEPHSLNTGSFF